MPDWIQNVCTRSQPLWPGPARGAAALYNRSMAANRPQFFDSTTEQGVLRLSIAASLLLAAAAVVFGLLANSSLIIFDGIYGLIDVVMTWLSLLVARLIALSTSTDALQSRLNQRFTMGFWHLEPIVLGVSGTLMIGAALYALVNAVDALMSGGRHIALGPAIAFAGLSIVGEGALAGFILRANRRIGSEFIALDAKNWVIAASMSACYLLAFLGGVLVQGTSWAWVGPYIDPAILAFVCVLVMIAPLGTVRRALAGILLVTPPELQAHVDAVARAIVAKHGFVEHRSYVARVGRGEQIELFFVVPRGRPAAAAGGMGPAARRDRRRAGRGLARPLADHHVHHRPRVDDLGRQDDRSSFSYALQPIVRGNRAK